MNATRIGSGFAAVSAEAAGGFLRARAQISDQDYDQTFSAVFAGRNGERLTNTQHVDTAARRLDVSWSRGGTLAWLVDAGYRQVDARPRGRTRGARAARWCGRRGRG